MIKRKICSKCKVEKDYWKEFSSNGKSTRSVCKTCEATRAREHYEESQKYLRSLKDKCSVCGYDKNPAVLEYHHTDDNKEGLVSRIAKYYLSPNQKEKLHREIEKCVLICANCHREEHFKEYNRY